VENNPLLIGVFLAPIITPYYSVYQFQHIYLNYIKMWNRPPPYKLCREFAEKIKMIQIPLLRSAENLLNI
tara:strand:+ start:116 stop:325 length:210 start_codon:yes stop_codon:yes gene_type:complete